MARIHCPCGFAAETSSDIDFDEARAAFDAHSCPSHPPAQQTGRSWAGVVGALIFWLAVVAICYIVSAVK